MESLVILLLIIGLNRIFPLVVHKSHVYVGQKMSWRNAQQYCRLHYDDLSTISNIQENDEFLQSRCGETFANECHDVQWIGLHTDADDPVWRWTWDEEKANFSRWAFKQPSVSGSDNCAYHEFGKWYSASCIQNITFFCMVHSPQLFLVKMNMTWEEALDYCKVHYTGLASLNSYQENALAVRKSTAAEVQYVWIGLHFVDRYWIWMDGHALEYEAWSKDEYTMCPARNLRCGALETDMKIWKPRDCGEKLNFICYKKGK